MKILTVVGARPQFVKAATVSRQLREPRYGGIDEVIVHTGQHYDAAMSASFFDELDIPQPQYNLGVGSSSQGTQTGAVMAALEGVVARERPDWILVYGDTNSTLGGALVAAKHPVPLAHVEAGLRSFRAGMPEEVNRVVTDRLSQLLFCPSHIAVEHLRSEGRDQGVHFSGDVMYDGYRYYSQRISRARVVEQFGLDQGGYVLATVHRAENTDDPARFHTLVSALDRVSSRIPVVLPLHPRTRKAMNDAGLHFSRGVHVIDPVPYLEILALLNGARLVATDSGGLQKEAYFAGVPCVTLRDETEWLELLDSGWNRLAPPVRGVEVVEEMFEQALEFPRDTLRPGYYGDGHAAAYILDTLLGNR